MDIYQTNIVLTIEHHISHCMQIANILGAQLGSTTCNLDRIKVTDKCD